VLKVITAKDYYELLGVHRNAGMPNSNELTAAWRTSTIPQETPATGHQRTN
jgi:hypothetical protein